MSEPSTLITCEVEFSELLIQDLRLYLEQHPTQDFNETIGIALVEFLQHRQTTLQETYEHAR